MPNVLAVVEQRAGALRTVSEEVLAAAKLVADGVSGQVHALLIGGSADAASTLGGFGAEQVYVTDGDALAQYVPDVYAATVAERVRAGDYFAVIFGTTSQGKDLAPRVAAKLDLPLAADATALAVENGELVITRPVYA